MPSEQTRRASALRLPATTWTGVGSLARAADAARELGARRAFVFTDAAIVAAGHLERLYAALVEARAVEVFDAVEPEPTTDAGAQAVAALSSTANVDLIVSLGGGSVIDTAKCAMLVACNGGTILDYEDDGSGSVAAKRFLPHLAIPTTAGPAARRRCGPSSSTRSVAARRRPATHASCPMRRSSTRSSP